MSSQWSSEFDTTTLRLYCPTETYPTLADALEFAFTFDAVPTTRETVVSTCASGPKPNKLCVRSVEIWLSGSDEFIIDSPVLYKRAALSIRLIGEDAEKRSVISCNAHSMFQISGKAILELKNLKLRHLCDHEDKRNVGGVFFCLGKACVKLTNCCVFSSHGFAMWMVQDSKLTAVACQFESARRSGCVLFGKACVDIASSEFIDCAQHGICLRGSSRCRLSETSFRACGVRAVYVYGGAQVYLEGCVIEETKSTSHAAIELLHRSVTTDSTWKKQGKGKKRQDLMDCKVSLPALPVRAIVHMRRCVVRNNCGRGLLVFKSDTESDDASVEDCIFINNFMGNIETVYEPIGAPERVERADSVMWQFECDNPSDSTGRRWQSYDLGNSGFLEESFQVFQRLADDQAFSKCTLRDPLHMYIVDFVSMEQVNTVSFFSRSVRRHDCVVHSIIGEDDDVAIDEKLLSASVTS